MAATRFERVISVFRGRALSVCATLAVLIPLQGCGRSGDTASAAAPPEPTNRPAVSPARPGSPLPALPITNDARIALQRMVAAYKKLDSLQVRSDSDVEVVYNGTTRYHQETILKYDQALKSDKRGRLVMIVKDPLGGTNRFYADGSSVVHYTGVTNTFTRRSAKPDLSDVSSIIDRDSPQVMSPIAFLMSGTLPIGLGAARIVGRESVGPTSAIVIKGQFEPGYQRQLAARNQGGFGAPLKPTSGEFTLWLDPNTYLLLKSQGVMTWTGPSAANGKIVSPRLTFTETTTEIVQNPRFASDEFRFVAPKGVKEVFVERRGQ